MDVGFLAAGIGAYALTGLALVPLFMRLNRMSCRAWNLGDPDYSDPRDREELGAMVLLWPGVLMGLAVFGGLIAITRGFGWVASRLFR